MVRRRQGRRFSRAGTAVRSRVRRGGGWGGDAAPGGEGAASAERIWVATPAGWVGGDGGAGDAVPGRDAGAAPGPGGSEVVEAGPRGPFRSSAELLQVISR